ncbi:MAG: thiamine-phosphate kinase [Alphaproteobacteria bacterium]
MAEFDWIERYFAPLAGAYGRGLKDDGAVIDIPAGCQLVVSSDTSNRGDHFVEEMSPYDAARKCLRSNLSDMAAMGADLLSYQLNLALPRDIGEDWVVEFARGLAADQEEYGVRVSGGDTTGMDIGGLSVSITVLGTVPTGRAVPRGGAWVGDLVVVTGTLGDASINRLHIAPVPNGIAPAVREYARAAIDISDGLPADLGHICSTSGVGAKVRAADIPVSDALRVAIEKGETSVPEMLVWGEDYELCMAVAPQNLGAFMEAAAECGVTLAVVGEFVKGEGAEFLDENGAPIVFGKPGWQHF